MPYGMCHIYSPFRWVINVPYNMRYILTILLVMGGFAAFLYLAEKEQQDKQEWIPVIESAPKVSEKPNPTSTGIEVTGKTPLRF